MCLRVNARRSSVADVSARGWPPPGIAARRSGAAALLLERPVPVERLPGFAAGRGFGAGRRRAARGALPRSRRRPARARRLRRAGRQEPAHILETAEVALTALDVDAARCARLERNLARLGLARARRRRRLHPAAGDWWDGVPFDRMLADVPCSASGIARRHPDIKWLRRSERPRARSPSARRAILDALWQVLRPGGKLLYATCSVFPQENDAVIDAFVARAPARALRLPLADGAAAQGLPDAERDGFYYALIQKQA